MRRIGLNGLTWASVRECPPELLDDSCGNAVPGKYPQRLGSCHTGKGLAADAHLDDCTTVAGGRVEPPVLVRLIRPRRYWLRRDTPEERKVVPRAVVLPA